MSVLGNTTPVPGWRKALPGLSIGSTPFTVGGRCTNWYSTNALIPMIVVMTAVLRTSGVASLSVHLVAYGGAVGASTILGSYLEPERYDRRKACCGALLSYTAANVSALGGMTGLALGRLGDPQTVYVLITLATVIVLNLFRDLLTWLSPAATSDKTGAKPVMAAAA